MQLARLAFAGEGREFSNLLQIALERSELLELGDLFPCTPDDELDGGDVAGLCLAGHQVDLPRNGQHRIGRSVDIEGVW